MSSSYMSNRKSKLKLQDCEEDAKTITISNNSSEKLLQGLTIHINGYTGDVSQMELKRLILNNGGAYDHYFSRRTTTHMLATCLADGKRRELGGFPVVHPQWIIDSIAANKLISWQRYGILLHNENNNNTISSLNESPVRPQTNRDARSDGFIENYYKNSRLHHLSIWKTELAEMIEKIRSDLRVKAKRNSQTTWDLLKGEKKETVVMHIDMDCFFASVSLLDRPDLSNLPVGISHASNINSAQSEKNINRTNDGADVACFNYVAREKGVSNGMLVGTARKLCPDLILLPYDFEKYKAVSQLLYDVIQNFADDIEPISCDEVYIDATSQTYQENNNKSDSMVDSLSFTLQKIDPTLSPFESTVDENQKIFLANKIRAKIFQVTGCNASIGIGETMILARMATKMAKPNGAFILSREGLKKQLPMISVSELPGVGRVLEKKLDNLFNVKTCLDLFNLSKEALIQSLGSKTGSRLYDLCRGIDNKKFSLSSLNYTKRIRQSVSADVNYGIRFTILEEAHNFILKLSDNVSNRLNKAGLLAGCLTLKIMHRKIGAIESKKFLGHGACENRSRSVRVIPCTSDSTILGKLAVSLLMGIGVAVCDLRGLGLSCTKLEDNIGLNSYTKSLETEDETEDESSNTFDYFAQETKLKNCITNSLETEEKIEDKSILIKCAQPSISNTKVINWPINKIEKKPSKQSDILNNSASSLVARMFGKSSNLKNVNQEQQKSTITYESTNKYNLNEIDWAVFNNLPADIQKEITESIAKDASNSHKSLTNKSVIKSLKIGRKRVKPNIKREEANKLIFQKNKDIQEDTETILVKNNFSSKSPKSVAKFIFAELSKEIDMDVFVELPEEIRTELYEAKLRETGKIENSIKIIPTSSANKCGFVSRSCVKLLKPCFPTEMEKIRDFIRNWLTKKFSNVENLNMEINFNEFVIQLIESRKIKDLQSVLRFMRQFCPMDSQKEVVIRITEKAQTLISLRYGGARLEV